MKIGYKCEKCGYETDEELSLCPKCSAEEESESTYSKFKSILGNSIEMVSLAGAEFIEKHPKIKEHANILSDEASTKYVESGAKKHVDTFKTKSGEKLDVISGQAMYELVRKRLDIQDRYNDLLATKLHEALEKISELEKQLSELKPSKD